MRITVAFTIFIGFFGTIAIANAASLADMEKSCQSIARSMMEEPATYKFVSAAPASRDGNKGVTIDYTGTKENFKAKMSCFYENGEISKLHLEATLKDGEKVDEYLADFLVEQIKKDISAKK